MKRASWIIPLGVAALLAGLFVPVSRLRHTCVVCRLSRLDTTAFGLTRSAYAETDCSRWYAAHVEPRHDHLWERGTCRSTGNLIGMPMSVGGSPGRFPIHGLPTSVQKEVYRHFADPREAKRLFAGLTDARTRDDRLDEGDFDRGRLTVDALEAWASAGFPGTWDAWWDKSRADHAAERKAMSAWIDSGTKLDFDEWRRREDPGH